MKKLFPFLLGILLLVQADPLLAQGVEISIDHPEQVKAGEVFEVTLVIQKGDLTDYSRFSQDLPLGLNASNVSSPNADFSFDNQRIRIIWLKLPEEAEIRVTYNIQVDERLKGNFRLGGVFAYVVSDQREFLNVENERDIRIIPSSTLDPELIVDIKDFDGKAAVASAAVSEEKEQWAMAVRQTPVLEGSGSYLVKLLVQNPSGSKYAKIEENIPSGYLFESVDPHDGIESFSSSTVKFIWMKLPQEQEFELSYRLVPKRDEPQGEMQINGQLTYSAGNENKVVDIREVDAMLEEMTLAEKRTLLSSGTLPAASTPVVQAPDPEPELSIPDPEPVESTASTSRPGGASGDVIVNTPVLAAGSGVYFRVQLAANRRAFDAQTFYSRAGVGQDVYVERDEGLHKYTAGSFTDYASARAYRDKIEKLARVSGTFVVAYRDGVRIPVASVR